MITGLLVAVAIWLAYMHGWYTAHITIATECERIGKFYVKKKVYECAMIKNLEEDSED